MYPECIKQGFKEDCISCKVTEDCDSPRGWCIKPYRNHPKGCKNHGNKEGCPPNVPMLWDVFDKSKSIYLGINEYDMVEHIKNGLPIGKSYIEYISKLEPKKRVKVMEQLKQQISFIFDELVKAEKIKEYEFQGKWSYKYMMEKELKIKIVFLIDKA